MDSSLEGGSVMDKSASVANSIEDEGETLRLFDS